MNVRELIDILLKCEPSAEVVFSTVFEDYVHSVSDIDRVEVGLTLIRLCDSDWPLIKKENNL